MSRIPGIRRAFRVPRRADLDVDEEFAAHVEMRVHDLVSEGWERAAAEREAMRRFGDLESARTYCRRLHRRQEQATMRIERLASFRQDLTIAVRGLRRSPGFTLAAVVTLALGVGANVTMFGLVDRLLLRPPPGVHEPGALRRVYLTARDGAEVDTSASLSYPLVRRLQEVPSASAVAAYTLRRLPVGTGPGAREAPVVLASASYFHTLGVSPALGRFFTAAEDTPPVGTSVVVLSDASWRTHFGASTNVLGTTITIAGRPYEVIGVAPPGFHGTELDAVDGWIPISAIAGQLLDQYLRGTPWHEAANVGWLRGVVRLRAGVPEAQASAAIARANRGALEERARRDGWTEARVDSMRPAGFLAPLLLERGPDRTPTATIAVWLAAMAVVVLLIACANVANLLLARALRRQRETAVRLALGAGRRRLIRQLCTEGLVLALVGGVGALLVAHWGSALVGRVLLPATTSVVVATDPRLLAIAGAAVVLAALLTSLVPAVQASDVRLASALKSGAREGGGRRSRVSAMLVMLQAALSVVLLVGATLFVRSLQRAQDVELGFVPDGVLTAELDLASAGYTTDESLAIHERLLERVAALPGVGSAALSAASPFSTSFSADIRLPGVDSAAMPPGEPQVNAVTREYFATLGTRLVRGRVFGAEDGPSAAPALVVNETMARTLWPGRDAVGQCVIVDRGEGVDAGSEGCAEVIGVVEDVRWNDLQESQSMHMYALMDQNVWDFPLRTLFVRTTGHPSTVAAALREAAHDAAARLAYASVLPLADRLEPSLRPWRLGATVFVAFGGLALVLAALGLYATVSYNVAQRTREMGVRIALGARAGNVVLLVVRDGLAVVAIGIALGLVVVLAGGRLVGALLFETAPHDPQALSGVALALLLVALLACLLPAWRATRVAPGAVLRSE